LDFLEVLLSYENFIEINSRISSHYLSKLSIDIIIKALKCCYENKERAVVIFKKAINLFETNEKYQKKSQKNEISYMFSHLLHKIINDSDDVVSELIENKDSKINIKSDFLITFLHILQNINPLELSKWWFNQTTPTLQKFINLLSDCMMVSCSKKLSSDINNKNKNEEAEKKKIRKIIKLSTLDIWFLFVNEISTVILKNKDIKLLEQCIFFMVRFMNENKEDKNIDLVIITPELNKFLKLFEKFIFIDEKQTNLWKWCNFYYF
jgi:hypothetical protein